jgi:hypothetical protein
MVRSRKLLIQKAHQRGIYWLSLGYTLWLMLFQAGPPYLSLSQTDAGTPMILVPITHTLVGFSL